jgi:hypothetical protein
VAWNILEYPKKCLGALDGFIRAPVNVGAATCMCTVLSAYANSLASSDHDKFGNSRHNFGGNLHRRVIYFNRDSYGKLLCNGSSISISPKSLRHRSRPLEVEPESHLAQAGLGHDLPQTRLLLAIKHQKPPAAGADELSS